jgi:hypothetical protein
MPFPGIPAIPGNGGTAGPDGHLGGPGLIGRPVAKRRKLADIVTLQYVEPRTNVCRNTVGTRDAAALYGCSMGRIRQMGLSGVIWSVETADGRRYDADELHRLKAQRDKARTAGKLGGRPPAGFTPN